MRVREAAGILALGVVGALYVSSGLVGLAYALVFSAAVAPGIPLGIVLFGRHHPAAWVGGSLIGYGLTQLTLWFVIVTGHASAFAFVLAWSGVCVAALLTSRSIADAPVIPVGAWKAADTRAMLLVLLLVPVLMGLTYRNLGREENGNRYYRAYFTADFLWHSALAYELGKFSMPPRNPAAADPQPSGPA